MKIFAVLSLVALSLLQESLCTHLETCHCDQIRQLVNTTVQEAVAGLEERLTLTINSAISNIDTTNTTTLENLESSLTNTMEQLLQPIRQQLDYHLPLEESNSEDNPATSCKQLHEDDPDSPSGYYWISQLNSSSPVRVYLSLIHI